MNKTKKSIFVTGIHRSGTSWVAKMLSLSDEVLFRDEDIFSPKENHVSRRALVPWYWHYCITSKNEGAFRDYFENQINKTDYSAQILSEPLGVFSTEWIAKNFCSNVLLLVRHPASIVSSLVRLGWTYDFSSWLKQEELMENYLGDFKEEIKNPPSSSDIVGQGILLWRATYSVIKRFQETRPEWILVRLEDLNRDAVTEYEKLYQKFDLEFEDSFEQIILEHNQAGNTTGAPIEGGDDHRRDGAKMISIWKDRLEKDVIARVKEETEDTWKYWYNESDW